MTPLLEIVCHLSAGRETAKLLGTGRAASLVGIYLLNLKLKIIETLSGYIKTNVWEVKCAYATDIAGGNEKCFYIIRNSQGVIILSNKK